MAVDGSFFKANANKAGIYTEDKLNQQLAYPDKKIADYQQALAEQDAADDQIGQGRWVEDGQLQQKLERLRNKQAEKKALQQQLKNSGDKQVATVDADARLLTKRGQTIAGYNAQIAVDGKHKLIVAEAVTQDGNDAHQLVPMLEKTQDILPSANLTGFADRGYYEGSQLKACEEQSMTVYVAIPGTSKATAGLGRFTREQFKYHAEQDCYVCPQGNALTVRGQPLPRNGKWLTYYKSHAADCRHCPLREQCLTEKAIHKHMERWEHEAVIERHKQRMAQAPDSMRKRGALVEHPFGTLKQRAGRHHFLMRGLEKCRGEFSLMVLGYNFARILNILGADALRDYCARRSGHTLINEAQA